MRVKLTVTFLNGATYDLPCMKDFDTPAEARNWFVSAFGSENFKEIKVDPVERYTYEVHFNRIVPGLFLVEAESENDAMHKVNLMLKKEKCYRWDITSVKKEGPK